MKKRLLLCCAMITMAGCVSTEKLQQRALVFEQETLNQKDPINVLEVYDNSYFKGSLKCRWDDVYNKNTIYRESSAGGPNTNIIKDIVMTRRDKSNDIITHTLMSEPKIRHECLIESNKKYDSDECILYRRNEYKTSEICWFNFKKYLGADSYIKTEENFAQVSKFYKEGQKQCDEKAETTMSEKEVCKDKLKKLIRDYSKNGLSTCGKLYGTKYIEILKEQGDWYKWAIDHDPNAMVETVYQATGSYAAAQWYYSPKWSKDEAIEHIESKINGFGYGHLCDTTGWRAELKKLGYSL